jgi:hypothetical protein
LFDLDREGVEPIELQVDRNRAFNTTLTDTNSGLLAIDILHDGENILVVMVGQEIDDLTDISLSTAFYAKSGQNILQLLL